MGVCRLFLNLFSLVILALAGTEFATGHQCFICGDEKHLACTKFDLNNSTFIEECAPKAQGCGLQTSGGNVIRRSCERVQLEDCKTANEVHYCFCTGHLCNDRVRNRFIDDEDLAGEGSGDSISLQNGEISPQTPNRSGFLKFYPVYACISIATSLLRQ